MERGYSRDETTFQRLDRNFAEILQEVRVAQTGAQLLLAFQLTLAFTPMFAILTDFQRGVYVAALILGSAATALLIAPAPFHRSFSAAGSNISWCGRRACSRCSDPLSNAFDRAKPAGGVNNTNVYRRKNSQFDIARVTARKNLTL